MQYVKGLDLSPQEIAEAQRRYEELQHKFGGARACLLRQPGTAKLWHVRAGCSLSCAQRSLQHHPLPPPPLPCCAHTAQTLRAEFQQIDTLGVAVHDAGRQFDAATCMFALHYFFDREESLSTLMTTVANNLKPGACVRVCALVGVGRQSRAAAPLRLAGSPQQLELPPRCPHAPLAWLATVSVSTSLSSGRRLLHRRRA